MQLRRFIHKNAGKGKRGCWAIAAVAFLASCLPDPLEVKDIPTVEPDLVVATQLVPDQELVVWLTSTFGIKDANEESDPGEVLDQVVVNDAFVTLSGPGGTDTLEFIDSGLYGGVEIPFTEGEAYDLLIKSESLGEARATSVVQPKVNFNRIRGRMYYNIYGDTLGQITFTVVDPPEKNWYMLNVQRINSGQPAEIIREAINPDTFTSLLDDAQFNGSEYGGQLDFTLKEFSPGDSVVVSISNISQDYFRFMEQRLNNRLNFIEFLSEPVNYPSNVTGGKGFFNLHVPDARIIPLWEE